MINCPNCGLIRGLHASILPGCMCAQTPQQAFVAQPEQEPVAWFHLHNCEAYFTTEPSEDMLENYWTPLYTTPPQRIWVQLTDEELSILGEKFTHPDEGIDEVDFGMEVQRILKEKNT